MIVAVATPTAALGQTAVGQKASADSSGLEIAKLSVGLNSVYKVGRWTPLTVEFVSAPPAGSKLVIEAPDPDGNLTFTSSTETVPNGLYGEFRVGRQDSTIRFHIEHDGIKLFERTVRTAYSTDVRTDNSDSGDIETFEVEEVPASIEGTTFLDANSNGVFDEGEEGRSGIKIFADRNDDGIKDADEPAATTTDSGAYIIPVKEPGTYVVREIQGANHSSSNSNNSNSNRTASIPPAIDLLPHLVCSIGPARGFDALDTEVLDDETSSLFDDKTHSVTHVQLGSASELPERPNGLDAVDVLVLASKFELSDEQVDAIETWVRAGGHLVICSGKTIAEYAKSPLADKLKTVVIADEKPVVTYELTNLESYSGRSSRIGSQRGSRTINTRSSVPFAKVKSPDEFVVESGRDGPLIVQGALGFGRISFVSLDFNEGPLSQWDALPAVCHRLIFGKRFSRSDKSGSTAQRLSRSGVTDIATQLLETQGEFEGVKRATSWIVLGMMLLYLLIIGPLDYLIVHKILRRPHWTWVTFPLLVAAGAFVAVSAAKDRNGDQMKVNHLEVIDFNPSSGNQARGHSVFGLYSPVSQRMEVGVDVNYGQDTTIDDLGWSGVPENIFGGMYRSGGVALGRTSYSFSDDNRSIDNLPIQTWSTQRLATRWQSNAPINIESKLGSTPMGVLTGSFTHNLPYTIDRWIIAYGNRVYGPGTRDETDEKSQLKPGRRWIPGTSRELRSFLTGVRTKTVRGDDGTRSKRIVHEQTEYDSLSNDPEYVLRMMTFHSIAGGTKYTGLRNDLFRNFDLSELVPQQAVLFGHINEPTAVLKVNGEATENSQYSGFVRLILPVTRQSTVPTQLMDLRTDLQKQHDAAAKAAEEKAAEAKATEATETTEIDKDDAGTDANQPTTSSGTPDEATDEPSDPAKEQSGDVSTEETQNAKRKAKE